MLEEIEEHTNLVKRQADDVDQIGDLHHDFQAEFAAAKHAGDLAILAVRTAIDLVSDQHGAALFQPPDRADMGQLALALVDAVGENRLSPLGPFDLVRRTEAAPPPLGPALAFF